MSPVARSVEGPDAARLLAWLAPHRPEMESDVLALARRETPSDDKALLDAGLTAIERWLATRLGEPAAVRRVDGAGRGDILVADYPGAPGTAWVTALCHYDTVWPAGTLDGWPALARDGRLTGPGVFDMKAGLVQFAWGLRAADAVGVPRVGLRLVLTGDEEIGSLASRPTIEAEVVRGAAALVFEPSGGGALKTARKASGHFRLEVRGVEAHAGLDPTGGASAVDELAHAVLAVHALADPDAGTSLNVGVVGGGTHRNVIAGAAFGEIDARAATPAEARRVETALHALRARNPRAGLVVTGGWTRPAMPRSAATGRLFATAREVAAALGLDLGEIAVGGVSDGNFAAALGVPVLDGMGAVGAGAHSRGEWVDAAQLPVRAALLAGLLGELAGGR